MSDDSCPCGAHSTCLDHYIDRCAALEVGERETHNFWRATAGRLHEQGAALFSERDAAVRALRGVRDAFCGGPTVPSFTGPQGEAIQFADRVVRCWDEMAAQHDPEASPGRIAAEDEFVAEANLEFGRALNDLIDYGTDAGKWETGLAQARERAVQAEADLAAARGALAKISEIRAIALRAVAEAFCTAVEDGAQARAVRGKGGQQVTPSGDSLAHVPPSVGNALDRWARDFRAALGGGK